MDNISLPQTSFSRDSDAPTLKHVTVQLLREQKLKRSGRTPPIRHVSRTSSGRCLLRKELCHVSYALRPVRLPRWGFSDLTCLPKIMPRHSVEMRVRKPENNQQGPQPKTLASLVLICATAWHAGRTGDSALWGGLPLHSCALRSLCGRKV